MYIKITILLFVSISFSQYIVGHFHKESLKIKIPSSFAIDFNALYQMAAFGFNFWSQSTEREIPFNQWVALTY